MSIKFTRFVKIHDITRLISTLAHKVTILVEGEMGSGKSSILKSLQKIHGDKYEYVYLDCPTIMEGALAMDIPVHDEKALLTYISARLKLASGKPVMIMLDEFLKTDRLLKKMFTRLVLEKIIGDVALPEGSIVFATSNNASDGVGDTIEAHVGNRVMRIKMAKPTPKEWNLWAGENGISVITRTCVALNSRMLASYLDEGQEDNPYIFNPRRAGQTQFVSPRSLALADEIIRQKNVLGDELTTAALCGTLGDAAGEMMSSFVQMEKDIIPVDKILKDPTIAVPDNAGALLMTLFNAVDTLDTQDELSTFMDWANRIQSTEIQGVFFTMLVQSPRTARMALRNTQISKWSEDNYEILV